MTEEEYSSIVGTLYRCRNPAVAARLEHSLALAEQGEFVENAKTTCWVRGRLKIQMAFSFVVRRVNLILPIKFVLSGSGLSQSFFLLFRFRNRAF